MSSWKALSRLDWKCWVCLERWFGWSILRKSALLGHHLSLFINLTKILRPPEQRENAYQSQPHPSTPLIYTITAPQNPRNNDLRLKRQILLKKEILRKLLFTKIAKSKSGFENGIFLVSRNFFSWTLISKMGVKMNLMIITKNHAADSDIALYHIGFLTKLISKPNGRATAMPTAWELILQKCPFASWWRIHQFGFSHNMMRQTRVIETNSYFQKELFHYLHQYIEYILHQ